MTRFTWSDLLAVPFLENGDNLAVGLDCWGQAREIASRIGLVFPSLLGPSVEASDVISQRFEYLGPRWTCLGKIGDLFLSDPCKYGFISHVSVVVDVQNSIVLSTSKKTGPYAWPASRVRCELGVVRLK